MTTTIWGSLAERSRQMAVTAFDGIETLEDWHAIRAARKTEFLRGLGLHPLPERGELAVRECGEVRGEGFRMRKVGFQILPHCWASAAFFYPDPAPADPTPGVLYVCGHAPNGIYHYQSHPILWARRGYVCLILDTIEQSDNPGEHHGFNLAKGAEWLALGYSSAGGELWNSMRALDLLAADPSVDADRLGATGVSGGGSLSFLLAATDERVQAVSSLCGISTPLDAIANRHLLGHCDCFYPHNLYGRDLSEYAALIAPRAAQFCFADHDPLFHPAEVRTFVERTRKIFTLHDAEGKCRIETCPGPHGDHPEFDSATQKWFDRYLAGSENPVLERGGRELTEIQTTVFNGLPPLPNHLDLLPQLISPKGGVSLPESREEWDDIRAQAVQKLREEILPLHSQPPEEGFLSLEGDWRWGETPVREHSGAVEGVEISLRMVSPPESKPKLVIAVAGPGQNAHHALVMSATNLDRNAAAYAGFEPRWASDRAPVEELPDAPPGSRLTPVKTSLIRALALAGATPVMWTIQDLGVLLDYLETLEEARDREVILYGKGEAGVAALYRAAIDERVKGVVAEDIPGSHRDGAPILGVLRALDLPQAAGLLCPRKLVLVNPVYVSWNWPVRLYERLGVPSHFTISGENARVALESVMAIK